MTIRGCDDRDLFAAYHAIYGESNHTEHDWCEEMAVLADGDEPFFMFDGEDIIGGFALNGAQVSLAFLATPFSDRAIFWKSALGWAEERRPGQAITLFHVTNADAEALVRLGARMKWAQRRMIRPTCPVELRSVPGYSYASPRAEERPEIVRAVYEAHRNGYIATACGEPDRVGIGRQIAYRFEAFHATNSLHMGVIARDSKTGKIAGVCIAGVYPDSPNRFSTIHQISVVPAHRRKGLASSMIRWALGRAHPTSPAMTLQVLVGNPAELAYRRAGFVPSPAFVDLGYDGFPR